MVEDASQCATKVLDDLEGHCERLVTIDHERDLAVGSAAAAIVRAVETHGADEIVIGSRGVGRMRALLGSVAHDVIHLADCPVTVIPERMADGTRHSRPRRRAPSERAQSWMTLSTRALSIEGLAARVAPPERAH